MDTLGMQRPFTHDPWLSAVRQNNLQLVLRVELLEL